jgi:hypothetical protein
MLLLLGWLPGCAGPTVETDTDAGETDAPWGDGDPWADAVVSFVPGDGAGFGQDKLPDVVLGPPTGHAGGAPSTDVLSLGNEGTIVLSMDDYVLVDGPGVDLTVFENPFPGWTEPAFVAVSDDGATWHEWPCDPLAEGQPGCAGVHPVQGGPDGTDPLDPTVSGGDPYDLVDVGVTTARYVRLRDTGTNQYDGNTGGFDLDALAVIHGVVP